ncbi:gliding motility-associated ABC transporter substrate-binding protein GldG [Formosa sediminum]|uniref:Gliding motility-associated ABC transporter substrate-binding protein GldG n=1 Tax=Formosa sediminum TaxID=2594004 RepID=A0A516GV75_9FLAO|nr:gliding motility-associated ABC transporter substrate-binding protein GldG [Formosa sediminum]QDO95431.1 gliding motility-associated ABC transporter substrate-binding protein GldG [Formosa sediminum]
MSKNLKHIILIIGGILALNLAGNTVYKRFDLTQDQRYTLSSATQQIVADVNSPVIIDVFLEGEGFPSEFRRLQTETKQLLEEFYAQNSNIKFNFINPLEQEANRDQVIQQLNNRGLTPMQLTVQENGKSSQEIIFPWALASYNDVTVKIPLVKNKLGASQQELVTNSVQHLEYAFADGLGKLVHGKSKKIAILKGNGELEDQYLADFLTTIKDYYFLAPFTLDSVASQPENTLKKLQAYDLIIAAKPTEAFSEKEKLVLDQYTMNGGKSLWLIDAVAMEKDSLYNEEGRSIALARDLNLTDMFFKYGVRINPYLVATPYSAPITLAIGEGSDSQFQNVRWPYSPLVNTTNTHPIVNNVNILKFDFANPIDTLKNSLEKTILLESAKLTKLEGTPREISLDIVTQEPNPKEFNKGSQPLAVLLEGEFTSAYKNRIKPFKLASNKDLSATTKMIVIADGDLIKNDVIKNVPQELGFDRWTGQLFGNKEFLLNSVNYLLDDNGLINIRSKEIKVAFLNHEKIAASKLSWQLLNTLVPILLLTLFGLTFNYLRKNKYTS